METTSTTANNLAVSTPTLSTNPGADQQAQFSRNLQSANVNQNATTITIKQGDTLSQLALAHHTTIASLANANHISNPDMIYAGNKLLITNTQPTSATIPVNQSNDKTVSMPTANITTAPLVPTLDSGETAARDYIIAHESGGSYTAQNGKYIGKYQLDASYLNGDFSPANQERVAQDYVMGRYGSWTNAMSHWKTHHWY